jgi:methionine aminopeptidase
MVLNDDIIGKYNSAANICGKVFNKIKQYIFEKNERNVGKLSIYGNNLILEELNLIYKNETSKYIAFPVSISLNNCISNYIYDYSNIDSEYNIIKDSDVIKVELGVSICGCIAILTETFVINETDEIKKIINFLNKMQRDITKLIKHEQTADEMRIYIESKSTENNVFPIENCISYQQDIGYMHTDESKYMILNYCKYYDMDDYLISPENINYEFEEDDVYTIDLSVIPVSEERDIDIKYRFDNNNHIYRFNEYNYALKLKNSRIFYNEVNKKHENYAFELKPYLDNIKNKIGITECVNNNILEKLPIKYVKPDCIPVITKKFTIIVGKNSSKILKYFKK